MVINFLWSFCLSCKLPKILHNLRERGGTSPSRYAVLSPPNIYVSHTPLRPANSSRNWVSGLGCLVWALWPEQTLVGKQQMCSLKGRDYAHVYVRSVSMNTGQDTVTHINMQEHKQHTVTVLCLDSLCQG